jgi:hypothetical protein
LKYIYVGRASCPRIGGLNIYVSVFLNIFMWEVIHSSVIGGLYTFVNYVLEYADREWVS